jgi:hypothetical protein
MRSAAVRQNRARAAGKDGGHPFTPDGETTMADREDTAMDWHESPGRNSILDQPHSQTQLDQLSPGDDAMLSLGQLANRQRRRVTRCNVLSPQ